MTIYNGTIEMGIPCGQGDCGVSIAYGTTSPLVCSVNSGFKYPSMLTSPTTLTTLKTQASGDILNVPSEYILFQSTGINAVASFGPDVVCGGGRVAVVADSNWTDTTYREPVTAERVVKNLARFLHGSRGSILLFGLSTDNGVQAQDNIDDYLAFAGPIMQSMGYSVTTLKASSLPNNLGSYTGLHFFGVYDGLSEDDQTKVVNFIAGGRGYFHGGEFGCCPDNNASFANIFNSVCQGLT